MESYEILWKTTLPEIENTVSSISFETHIKQLVPVDIVGNKLILCTESQLFADNAQGRLRPAIIAALTKSNSEVNDFEIYVAKNREDYLAQYCAGDNFKPEDQGSPVNPKFTFESFVVGPSNEFIYAAAKAVAETPGESYNPLFIYGGTGLGKTHILMAIANYVKLHFPTKNVLYATCEQFTNQHIESLSKGKASPAEFRRKYRNVDVLLIDDVQFLAKKQGIQTEFFHTFNALQTQGKQIILTSDKPPKEMETLEERIRSRFEWGLMADIGVPDYETRMAILRKKAESDNFNIDDDILNYIATNIKSNVRELEGALNKLLAFNHLEHTDITMEIAERELANIITPDKPREITPQLIVEVVSEHFHISVDQMISKNRSSDIAKPRQIAMYLCKNMTSSPLDAIGALLGGRDHSTIIHGIKKVTEEYEGNETTRALIETIKKKINPN